MENSIGFKLKKIREDLGLTQVELAKILNCSDSMISHIENNTKRSPFLDYIYFAKHYGIDLNKLFEDNLFELFVNEIEDFKRKNK